MCVCMCGSSWLPPHMASGTCCVRALEDTDLVLTALWLVCPALLLSTAVTSSLDTYPVPHPVQGAGKAAGNKSLLWGHPKRWGHHDRGFSTLGWASGLKDSPASLFCPILQMGN